MAADGAGNLYVAEGTGSSLLRQVVIATGAVMTLLSDAAIDDVAPDEAGHVYSLLSHGVRRLALATGLVTTIAGLAGVTGSADGTGAVAPFNNPRGIAEDGAGNLYAARGTQIGKVVAATGATTTVAGLASRRDRRDARQRGRNGRGGPVQHAPVGYVPGLGLAISDFTENSILHARALVGEAGFGAVVDGDERTAALHRLADQIGL